MGFFIIEFEYTKQQQSIVDFVKKRSKEYDRTYRFKKVEDKDFPQVFWVIPAHTKPMK